jgi:hypothetical protein
LLRDYSTSYLFLGSANCIVGKVTLEGYVASENMLLSNFSQILAKKRIGNKTIKRYHTAITPYLHVFEHKDISFEINARLMNLYIQQHLVERS